MMNYNDTIYIDHLIKSKLENKFRTYISDLVINLVYNQVSVHFEYMVCVTI